MQTGDIVFFKSNSFIGKTISFLTHSPYSHVALVIGDDEIIEADSFIKVRTRKLSSNEIVYVKELGKHLSSEQKEMLVTEAKKFIGRNYDYISIVKWFFRLVFRIDLSFVDNANSLICSELIDRSYELIGIDLVPDRVTGDVTPYHLLVAEIK